MKKFIKLMLSVLFFVSIVCCQNNTETINSDSNGSSLFEEKNDGLVLVTNEGLRDLVLFYDSVRSANLVGGITGGKSRHRVKLPDSGKLYIIHAVSYDDYKKVAGDNAKIASLKVIDSALVYSDPVNETSCSLGDSVYGGDCELRFQNQTPYYIQVGKNSANDEAVFYTMRPNSTESAFVDYDRNGYILYLTCNLPIKRNNKIIGIQRKFVEDWSDAYMPTTSTVTPVTISAATISSYSYYTEGYIRLVNNSGKGYSVQNGSTVLYSTLDHGILANGNDEVYQLAGSEEGRSYSQLKLIGATAKQNKDIPAFAVKSGYKYTITLNDDGTVDISEGKAITEEEGEEIVW